MRQSGISKGKRDTREDFFSSATYSGGRSAKKTTHRKEAIFRYSKYANKQEPLKRKVSLKHLQATPALQDQFFVPSMEVRRVEGGESIHQLRYAEFTKKVGNTSSQVDRLTQGLQKKLNVTNFKGAV